MIRQSGEEPTIVDYINQPLTKEQLKKLLDQLNMSPTLLIRDKEAVFTTLNLARSNITDDELIDAMVAHPILINRPIVSCAKGTLLCRPAEKVLDILSNPNIGPFTKSNGEVVIDDIGRRLL